MTAKRAREIGQWGLVAVLISILLYFGDVSGLSHLPAVHWPSILFVFLTTGGSILIHNLRWTSIVQAMVNSSDSKINFFQFFRWLLNSYALGTLIPSDISLAGVRTLYLNRTQILPLSASFFSVLLDRFFDLIVLLALVPPAILFVLKLANATEALSLLGLILAAISVFVLWKKEKGLDALIRIYRSGMEWLLRLPVLGKWMGEKWKRGSEQTSFKGGSIHQLMGWSLIKYLLLVLRFYFTGQAFGVEFSFLQGFFFIPFIQLVSMFNLTPGGLGLVEMGSYGALMLMGVPESKIMVFVIGQRVLASVFTIGLALMSQLIFLARTRLREGVAK
jgi:uncharacterized protein (TIRG00374 family)